MNIFDFQQSTDEEVRISIVELYLNVKIRSTEDVLTFLLYILTPFPIR